MSYQEFSNPGEFAQAWAADKKGREVFVIRGDEIDKDEDHLYLIQHTPLPTGGRIPIGASCPISEASYIRIAGMIERLRTICDDAEQYGEDAFREPQ